MVIYTYIYTYYFCSLDLWECARATTKLKNIKEKETPCAKKKSTFL